MDKPIMEGVVMHVPLDGLASKVMVEGCGEDTGS